jgi:hypothetical protein
MSGFPPRHSLPIDREEGKQPNRRVVCHGWRVDLSCAMVASGTAEPSRIGCRRSYVEGSRDWRRKVFVCSYEQFTKPKSSETGSCGKLSAHSGR